MNKKDIVIRPIPKDVAYQLVSMYHYSRVMPKLTSVCYGGFIDGRLAAVVTFGWGVRPLHTIRKLFPKLDTRDYFEIGKMCLDDELPRNSESYFLARVIKDVRVSYPEKKIIFTWADGIMGKPGYVYQASNFYYGGYIWTDTYVTNGGEKVHPRTSGAIIRKAGDGIKRARPSKEQLTALGIKHYKGKQFRYAYFLRNEKELIQESTVSWTRGNYPKQSSLEWMVQSDIGLWVASEMPNFTQNYEYNSVKDRSEATQGIML